MPQMFFFLAVFLTLAVSCPASAQEAVADAFTVADIAVDVSAENAVVAREKALAEGQAKAAKILAERLLPEGRGAGFAPEVSDIALLIRDFSIRDEKLSRTRYTALLTYRFEPEAVRSYFANLGEAISATAAAPKPSPQPSLIVPVYQYAGQNILWDEPNPWRQAWAALADKTDIAVPLGDIADLRDAPVEKILSGDRGAMLRLARRYGASDGLLAIALPMHNDPSLGLKVLFYEFIASSLEPAGEIAVPAAADPALVFAAAIDSTREFLRARQEKGKLLRPSGPRALKVEAVFASMKDWVEMQKRLKNTVEVSAFEVQSLKKGVASLDLSYRGDVERLRLALRDSGLEFSEAAPGVSGNYGGYGGGQTFLQSSYRLSLVAGAQGQGQQGQETQQQMPAPPLAPAPAPVPPQQEGQNTP